MSTLLGSRKQKRKEIRKVYKTGDDKNNLFQILPCLVSLMQILLLLLFFKKHRFWKKKEEKKSVI